MPNDCDLHAPARRLILLTGPNMSGKSTYIRQNALIVLLAQIGSFVPAKSAQIGVVDRIFTRVGSALASQPSAKEASFAPASTKSSMNCAAWLRTANNGWPSSKLVKASAWAWQT